MWVPEIPLEELRHPPSALDLLPIRICGRPGPCPWEDAFDLPFEIPSLVIGRPGADAPLAKSPFALREEKRSAIGALAVRHHWTGSGYTSGYAPARFAGNQQMDLLGFASTVMLEQPRGASSLGDWATLALGEPYGESQRSDQAPMATSKLNESISVWTYGGGDRGGQQQYSELWRGVLAQGKEESIYDFKLISNGGGPPPTVNGLLLADVGGQRLVYMGGVAKGQLVRDIWAFDLRAMKWIRQQMQTPSTVGLSGAATTVANGIAYFYGGQSAQGGSGELWQMDLGNLRFQRLSADDGKGPGVRAWSAMALHPEEPQLLLYGGNCGQEWCNDMWAYDLERRSWRRLTKNCQPSKSCPAPARGNLLLSTGVDWSVGLSVGTPTTGYKGTEREWRFSLIGHNWVTEQAARMQGYDDKPPQKGHRILLPFAAQKRAR
jgi:hypothetical protein